MKRFHWQSAALDEVFVLPAQVVDGPLRIATPDAIRLLLWFSRHHQTWDPAACAADLGISPQEGEAHLRFWVEQGVLADAEAEQAPSAPAPTKTPRPAAVKPRVQEVLAYQRQHPDFQGFLEAASAALGKPIGHGDTATLLYLLDTVGLPGNVILLEIAYAVSIGKGNMHYIEKLALNWADEDITTVKAADDRIRWLESNRRVAQQVETWLGLSKPLTNPQAEMAWQWVEEWHFSQEMVCRAAAITSEKTGKFSPAYTNKILERWYTEGIDSPDKIPTTPLGGKKQVAATNPAETSLDMEGFEESLLRYRPKFKAPDKKN